MNRSQKYLVALIYIFNPIGLLLTWALRNTLALFFTLLLAELTKNKEKINVLRVAGLVALSSIHETTLGLSALLMFALGVRGFIRGHREEGKREIWLIELCFSLVSLLVIIAYVAVVMPSPVVTKVLTKFRLAGGSIKLDNDPSSVMFGRLLTVLLPYLPILPAILLGKQRGSVLKYLELILFVILFSWIIPESLLIQLFPGIPSVLISVKFWVRWIFISIIPLSIRAADGLKRFALLSRPYIMFLLMIGLLFSVVPTTSVVQTPTKLKGSMSPYYNLIESLGKVLDGRKVTTMLYSKVPLYLQPQYAAALEDLSKGNLSMLLLVPKKAYKFAHIWIRFHWNLVAYALSSICYLLSRKAKRDMYISTEERSIFFA